MASQNKSGVTGQSTGRQQCGPLIDLDLNLAVEAPISMSLAAKTTTLATKKKFPDWTDAEMKVLIGAKRHEHYSIVMNGSTQQKMTNAKQKWKVVAQFMQEEGSSNLVRDAASCKKKWQMIDEKFKKIHDWEKKEKSGQVSYFNMDDKERKEKRLLTNFSFDLFTDLLSWYGDVPRITPPQGLLADSSLMAHNSNRNPYSLSSETPAHSPTRTTAPAQESAMENSEGPSSPQDFSGPSRRGVKHKENSKEKSGKEKQANLTAIADSCAQMVAATKRDIEIRERQENVLVAAISGANASTMEQLL
ncbi:unnamed protein product [Calypogeia fissa]